MSSALLLRDTVHSKTQQTAEQNKQSQLNNRIIIRENLSAQLVSNISLRVNDANIPFDNPLHEFNTIKMTPSQAHVHNLRHIKEQTKTLMLTKAFDLIKLASTAKFNKSEPYFEAANIYYTLSM